MHEKFLKLATLFEESTKDGMNRFTNRQLQESLIYYDWTTWMKSLSVS